MERKMLKSRRVTRNNIDPLLARRRGLKMLEPAHHSDSTKRDLRAGSASAMEKSGEWRPASHLSERATTAVTVMVGKAGERACRPDRLVVTRATCYPMSDRGQHR